MRPTRRVQLAALSALAASVLVGAVLRADPPEPSSLRPWLRGQSRGGFDPPARAGIVRTAALDAGSAASRVAAVASRYLAWGRVDDELRWAPWLCRMPNPSVPRASRAEGGAHARKLYFLYARDREGYLGGRTLPGQTVVKEAWSHRPIAPRDAVRVGGGTVTTTLDGQLVEPDQARGLYVMTYLGRGAPDTDEGWVYGTVEPNGVVSAVGRIESCMGCHREATHGRLFGLQRALPLSALRGSSRGGRTPPRVRLPRPTRTSRGARTPR